MCRALWALLSVLHGVFQAVKIRPGKRQEALPSPRDVAASTLGSINILSTTSCTNATEKHLQVSDARGKHLFASGDLLDVCSKHLTPHGSINTLPLQSPS